MRERQRQEQRYTGDGKEETEGQPEIKERDSEVEGGKGHLEKRDSESLRC